jgi:hypothetical protein
MLMISALATPNPHAGHYLEKEAMGFMNSILGNKEKSNPELLGNKLSSLVLSLGSVSDTKQFMKEMDFSSKDIERFNFCLIFFGIAHVIFWVNYSNNPDTRQILDSMLDNIMNSLERDERNLRIGDYIVNNNEISLIDDGADKDTLTSYYVLVYSLYDRRVQQYHEGIIQQAELAYKAKAAKDSQKDNIFALDPMGKIFAPHYLGNEYMNDSRFFMSISLFLANFSNRVIQGIDYVMENR